MKRPWQVWLAFAACVVGAAAAMVWLTQQALQSDRLRRVAEAEAELEQRVSLSLWRMDTELAPIVAAEVIRPPSAYRPTVNAAPNAPAAQAAIAPAELPEFVLLQFEARPDGSWHSPQAPDAMAAARLAELSRAVQLPQLAMMCSNTPLPSTAVVGENYRAVKSAKSAEELNRLEKQLQFVEGNRSNEPVQQPQPPVQTQQSAQAGKGQVSKATDFEQRNLRYQSAAQLSFLNQERAKGIQSHLNGDENPFGELDQTPTGDEPIGVSRPMWVGNRLLLARRVGWNGETVVQGCWLDWLHLKTQLLAEAVDLLPNADLVPAPADAATDPGRMLAGLPVRLVVGRESENGMAAVLSPTLSWALWMGWGAVLLATAAAAALLHGVMTLSERRAAFVSSVTHELRTPLTTFRMYAEMLARGMVPDAQRRQEYFNTLQHEAERLTLLVENVLAYARLERGRKPHAFENVTLTTLLDRVQSRLVHRAEQAGMQCDVQSAADAAGHEFTTDLNVVEQVLFNLVDNAAKYAREAEDRRIHIEADRDGQWMRLTVRDHGPGIAHSRTSRRLQAFGKSAQESADSAPGVGLGLALCGRLAAQLGGRLQIAATPGGGASVTLLLPAA